MTNNYYIEYQHEVSSWVIIEVNCRGCTVIDAAETIEDAAASMRTIEAIEGACKVAQNGLTDADQIAGFTL